MELPCKVTYIGDQSYGKFPKDAVSDQLIMEYRTFLPLLARFLPNGALNDNQRFKEYLVAKNDTKIYELADFMMMTLPSPRVSYYSSSNYWDIQRSVTRYSNEIIDALGFFPVLMDLDVLSQMETFS